MKRIPLAILLAVGFGCASTDYIYQPTEEANATASGYPAAYYPVPPEKPTGDVRVASMGVVEVQPPGNPGKVRALDVRMIISNANAAGPFQLDTRNVLVDLPNEGQSRPAFVNGDTQSLPVINIPAGQSKTIDLFYPLPKGYEKAQRVPKFDVSWQLRTPLRVVAQRTPFERIDLYPAYAYDYYGYYGGWGPYWYWDPFWPYPGYAFYHPHRFYVPGGYVRSRPTVIARPHGYVRVH